ncbi:hypothetical protein CDAR_454281 [Caerostris darwini]|uniref:Uncharacterized protein n=1 Tax=Caerostris darwini TaxID=1538125 RepID=A0AAV4V8J4_9ARAC|nr:hypothetical protein CDAR_454281 [Caerostris darwini]
MSFNEQREEPPHEYEQSTTKRQKRDSSHSLEEIRMNKHKEEAPPAARLGWLMRTMILQGMSKSGTTCGIADFRTNGISNVCTRVQSQREICWVSSSWKGFCCCFESWRSCLSGELFTRVGW